MYMYIEGHATVEQNIKRERKGKEKKKVKGQR